MSTEDDADGFVELTELHELWSWVFFTMGAAAQSPFDESGDPERRRRGREASLQLGRLVPVIAAALKVSMAHSDEFWQLVEKPILLKRVKW
jgi:hypothetical protein